MSKVAIVGSGSWATALAKIVLQNQMTIGWWVRRQDTIHQMEATGKNPGYLKHMRFDPSRVNFSSDINEVIAEHDILVIAIPSPYLRQSLEGITADLKGKKVVIATKGLIPPTPGTDEEHIMITDYLYTKCGVPRADMAIIAGPCHAEEIALERLSYLTIASESSETAEEIATLLRSDFVHTCTSNDVVGLEYSSVMKNIYALAAGMCQALQYGDNFQAVLVSNATKEIRLFTAAASTMPHHVSESGYLGDLLVTAYSQFSRNRQFGQMIGLGYSVQSAQLEMGMVAEGYYGTKAIHEANRKLQVNIPIAEAMYNILYREANAREEISALTEKLQ